MERTFRYGQNPHEPASASKMPRLRVLVQPEISFNAYLDVFVGYQVSTAASARFVYVKHFTPLFSGPLTEGSVTTARLATMNAGREYGSFVYRGHLSAAVAAALLEIMPAHTIAAETVGSDAVKYLTEPAVQKANRGLVVVEADLMPTNQAVITLENELHSVRMVDVKPLGDGWPSRVHRTLKFCRTIATNLYVGEQLVFTVCGEFDVVAGLRRGLEAASRAGLRGVDVATDACFGVVSPISLLEEHRVRRIFLFGEKATRPELLAALRDAGVEPTPSGQRAFSYLP